MGIKPDLLLLIMLIFFHQERKTRERKDEIDDIYTSTKGLATRT